MTLAISSMYVCMYVCVNLYICMSIERSKDTYRDKLERKQTISSGFEGDT